MDIPASTMREALDAIAAIAEELDDGTVDLPERVRQGIDDIISIARYQFDTVRRDRRAPRSGDPDDGGERSETPS